MPYENGMYVSPTRTETQRVAEWICDGIDPRFDFEAEAKSRVKGGCSIPEVDLLAWWKENLEKCQQNGAFVTDDGGWPRCGWSEVYSVGMAAQWPYWTPRPVVACKGVFGTKWMDFASITDVNIEKKKEHAK